MSLKAEIETWVKALQCFDDREYTQALEYFAKIADSSRILFNVALIHANMGDHRTAVAYFEQAQMLDQYFAISFFQCGVSHFLLGNFPAAAQNFQEAYIHLRENSTIDYEQIGLKFKLHAAEVLCNQGLSLIRMGQTEQGMRLLDQARKEKQVPEHDNIERAFAYYGRGCTVFSMPSGILFRPSDVKVKNLKARNYLGIAKLVAATSPVDAFVGFSGVGARSAPSTSVSQATSPSTSSPAEDKRSSPPSTARSFESPFPAATEERGTAPLKTLKRHKSFADIRSGAGTSLFPRNAPFDYNALSSGRRLPPINTDIYAGPSTYTHHPAASYSSPLLRNHNNSNMLPSTGVPMPPTPPDSDKGHKFSPVDRRDTMETRLGYLGEGGGGSGGADDGGGGRNSNLVDDLISVYSSSNVSKEFRRRPSLPFMSSRPHGQPIDRVANWATNQQHNVAVPELPMRYANPSVAASSSMRKGSISTLRRYQPRRVDGMERLRSGSVDDRVSPSLMGRDTTLDDILAARTNEMLSFRLKLHFEDEIRGMSLDADTPWAEFYARLQSKFGLSSMNLKYKDEDGIVITIADEDDWNSAIDAARESCYEGRLDGKLEIWVVEGQVTAR